MRRLLLTVLGLVLLGATGFTAYRLGLLSRWTGSAAIGGTASPENGAAGPAPSGQVANTSVAPAVAAPAGTAPSTPASAVPPHGTVAEPSSPSAAEPGASSPAGGTPIPPGLVTVGQPGQPVSNKAIEVRVTDVATAPTLGNWRAREGREFAIIATSWKSLIPPQKVNRKKAQDRTAGMGGLGFGGGATAKDKVDDEANTTLEDVPFAIGPLPTHVWLIVDGRDAEPIAVSATRSVEGPLTTGTLTIPGFEKSVSGGLAFEIPANASALSLLVLDSKNGHLLIPVRGQAPALAGGLGSGARSNELVDLAVTGTSWANAAPPAPGTRLLLVGMRGISRQPAIAQIPFGSFAFLQTDEGCVAQPEARVPEISRPLAPMGVFLPFVPSEGQLAFAVPAGTRGATLLVRLRQGGSIDLPALGDGSAAKPPVVAAHEDGKVLRVGIVGAGAAPEGLVRPRPGFEALAVDYVVENLKAGTGLELQPAQQFALADDQGTKYAPERASAQLPCRLAGANVVPAGGWRRFSLLYAVPAGQPLMLKYRGFESEGSLKIR
jgi:hypothetical protein